MATRFFQGLRFSFSKPQLLERAASHSSQCFESSPGLESRMTISVLPERSAVPRKDTWDTESIFASTAAWEAALETLKSELPQLASFAGTLHDPKKLLEFLEARGDFEIRLNKLYTYAGMHSSVDANDSAASAREGQAGGLYAAYREASAFATDRKSVV